MSEMNEKSITRYFRAFGDPTRFKILKLLSKGEMTVSELVKEIGLSQPTVSRHLALLRDAEIVVDRRDGQQVFYSLNKEAVTVCCEGFCDCLAIPVKVVNKKK